MMTAPYASSFSAVIGRTATASLPLPTRLAGWSFLRVPGCRPSAPVVSAWYARSLTSVSLAVDAPKVGASAWNILYPRRIGNLPW